jgi:hypothetical protein
LINAAAGNAAACFNMKSFIYRCPVTGKNVQGWVADDGSTDDESTYRTLDCPVCRHAHLVNPATGRVLNAPDE